MPEASKDASILIAISWQALQQQIQTGDELTRISNCTVVILFAGIFIEANLNYIIETLNKEHEMNDFLNHKHHPGLQDKLAWFYYSYIAKPTANSKKELKEDLYRQLCVKFPGFKEIYNFRNDISHGIIDSKIANIEDAKRLRIQAKEIVDELFKIAEQTANQVMPRIVSYSEAISLEKKPNSDRSANFHRTINLKTEASS
jgi:hypothetical protein